VFLFRDLSTRENHIVDRSGMCRDSGSVEIEQSVFFLAVHAPLTILAPVVSPMPVQSLQCFLARLPHFFHFCPPRVPLTYSSEGGRAGSFAVSGNCSKVDAGKSLALFTWQKCSSFTPVERGALLLRATALGIGLLSLPSNAGGIPRSLDPVVVCDVGGGGLQSLSCFSFLRMPPLPFLYALFQPNPEHLARRPAAPAMRRDQLASCSTYGNVPLMQMRYCVLFGATGLRSGNPNVVVPSPP
jgi:hypothetical protein